MEDANFSAGVGNRRKREIRFEETLPDLVMSTCSMGTWICLDPSSSFIGSHRHLGDPFAPMTGLSTLY